MWIHKHTTTTIKTPTSSLSKKDMGHRVPPIRPLRCPTGTYLHAKVSAIPNWSPLACDDLANAAQFQAGELRHHCHQKYCNGLCYANHVLRSCIKQPDILYNQIHLLTVSQFVTSRCQWLLATQHTWHHTVCCKITINTVVRICPLMSL